MHVFQTRTCVVLGYREVYSADLQCFLGPNVVSLLLEHGADPYECDVAGNDALMFASIFGRTDNVKFWLDRFPDWDLERKNKVVGGVALGHAVYMGPHRLELVKVLLEHGASLDYRLRIQGVRS